MSEYDKGFQRGQQENIYNGNGSSADWAGWQQGHMIKERNEEQLRQHMAAGTTGTPAYGRFVPQGSGRGGAIGILIILAFILALPFLLFALAVCAIVAVMAALSAPFLGRVARLTGVEYAGGFKDGFFLLIKSLGAYSAVFCALFAVLALLGNVSPPQSFLHGFNTVASACINLLINPHALAHVAWTSIIETIGALQIPALVAFSYAMRKSGGFFPTSARGLWQGMVTGFVIVSLCGGGTVAVLHKIFAMLA